MMSVPLDAGEWQKAYAFRFLHRFRKKITGQFFPTHISISFLCMRLSA
jgi:hypothetical protein